MLFLRKALFYLFLLLYLCLCPLTLLYAMGYLFKPGTGHGIMKTGLIAVSSAPPGATVYVENRRYTKRTPTMLRDLLPGEYAVRLVLNDHRPWSQIVPVRDGQSTVLAHVLLLPQRLPFRLRLPHSCKQLWPLPETHVFLAATGPTLGDVVVYDMKEHTHRPLLPPAAETWRAARLVSPMVVPGSRAVLWRVRLRDDEHWLWMELKAGETRVEEITRLFPVEPRQVLWDPLREGHLLAWQEGYLHRLDIAAQSLQPQWLTDVRGYSPSEKALFVLLEDGRLVRMDHEAKDAVALLDMAAIDPTSTTAAGLFQVTVLSKDLVFLLGEHGELWCNRFPYRLVPRGVAGMTTDALHERVLIWQGGRLGVIDVSRKTETTESFEAGPVVRWVFDAGKQIAQASWVYDGSHILFRDQDAVFLLELTPYGTPHLYELAHVEHETAITYNEETGTFYYLEPATGTCYSVEIVPKRELMPLPFPERGTGDAR